jgi:hypothetical protein
VWDKILSIVGGSVGGFVKDIIEEFHLPAEVAAKLQEAALMREFELRKSIMELQVADLDSARKREMEVKDPTNRRLAYTYTIGFFLIMGAELLMGLNGVVVSVAVQRTLDTLFGVMIAMILGVKEYYFGSSVGSDRKTDLLGKIASSNGKSS